MLYSPVFCIYPYLFQSNEAHATPCEALIGFFQNLKGEAYATPCRALINSFFSKFYGGGTYATPCGAFIGFFKL